MREVPLSQLAAIVGEEIGTVAKGIKISLFSGVILDTRVDTGRLRGNWQASTGSEIESEIDRKDKTGTPTVADMKSKVTEDGVDYLTNNLPYAEVWEERDGMVAKNVARIDRNIRALAGVQ